MQLLSKDFTNYCYNEIITISGETNSFEYKILKYRKLFESIFLEITKNEPQTFIGKYSLYGIILFITEKYNLQQEIINEIHNFRKFANIVIHDNQFNKKLKTNPHHLEGFCIKSICRTVSFFSDSEVPDILIQQYRDLNEITEIFKKKQGKETLTTIATFLSVSEEKSNIKSQTYYTIFCESEEDGTQFLLNIFPPFEYIGKYFKKFTKAYLHNISKSLNYENLYNTTNNSLIVVEPDYLIEARNIAECFQKQEANHCLYFINRFMSDIPTKKMIVGYIVNSLLDKYVINGKINFKEAFNMSVDVLQCIHLSNKELEEIKSEIENNHLKNIIEFSKLCRKNNPIIEPTFISPEFGLYGRLDIMLDKGEKEKDIIELKSGSPPKYEPWINHEMQVTAYNLLLDSTFTNRVGSSSIFYSRSENEYLKNVIKDFTLYQKLINLRNKIVLNELNIADGKFSIFDEICKFDSSEYPDFLKAKFDFFKNIIKTTNETELEYFYNFLYFIYNELRIAKIGSFQNYEGKNNGFASLWLDNLDEKTSNAQILHNLKFKLYIPSNETYVFELSKDNLLTNFREGDICIIYPQGSNKVYKNNQIFKGTIVSINKTKVIIKLRNNQLSKDIFSPNCYWIIEHDLMEINYYNQISSLFEFLFSNNEKKNKILGIKKPEYQKIEYNNKLYNENIKTIISKYKSAKDYFLLQGPPGTGKTSLALLLMIEETFAENKNAKIAVLAYTNRAVDEISKNLLKSKNKNIKNYIRIGSDYLEDERLLQKLCKGKTIDDIKTIIKDCRIFISTVSSFQNRYLDILERKEYFDVIFVDEASQIVEPQLVGVLMYCKKFVLIGDHHQLPAVILENENKYIIQNEKLRAIGLKCLSFSLFERLYIKCQEEGWDYAIDILKTHYRTHNDVANLFKNNYSVNLICGREEQTAKQKFFNSNSIDPVEKILSRSRTIFIPSHQNISESKYCTEEAIKIKKILDTILRIFNSKIKEDTIGIITPWRIQINKIKNIIDNEDICDKILIDTVERFQGLEKDIIIISLAINNKLLLRNLQCENLNKTVDRKLNVALSRAKEYLIILGCEEIINLSVHYKNVIKKIKEAKGYISFEESDKIFRLQ